LRETDYKKLGKRNLIKRRLEFLLRQACR
jgi:hypothetical protein